MAVVMFLIGLASGVITGMLSVGGGVILVFFLMMIPPLIIQTEFPMQTIAGYSIMQAFFATLSGAVFYFKERLIDRTMVIFLGIPSFFGGMGGVAVAHNLSDEFLRWFFAFMALSAALMMLIPQKDKEEAVYKNRKLVLAFSTLIGVFIGVAGGMLGIAAGFLFVPAMIYLFKIPIKKAIGTSLVACFLLAAGSFLMKLTTDAISLQLGIMLVAGGILGAQVGGRVNRAFSPLLLKRVTAAAILIISLTVVYDLF
ncbi:sulfite exporter TauE/SafE family protein [Salsuginibacillus halophilus]|nr:sulfite exporter TauE/SafE family protein [Salsuginibacillus halophilus]